MIKLIAALTMLIDHIGVVLSPTTLLYRIIGRLSMPLFAYCVARGFYYSNQHDTVKYYIMKMLILSVVSQLPAYLMTGEDLNICFTWTLSLLLLFVCAKIDDVLWKPVLFIIIAVFILFILIKLNIFTVDYGVYGITLPLFFYYLIVSNKEGLMNYTIVLLISWVIYILCEQNASSVGQVFSIPSALVLTASRKYDEKIKLPKWLFYVFYPVHIVILLIIKYLLK